MRRDLWIWSSALGDWRPVGSVNSGVNDSFRFATMRGLLHDHPGGMIYAFHPPDGRTERYWSPDLGRSLLKAA